MTTPDTLALESSVLSCSSWAGGVGVDGHLQGGKGEHHDFPPDINKPLHHFGWCKRLSPQSRQKQQVANCGLPHQGYHNVPGEVECAGDCGTFFR
jgi:hypothetical protein